MIHRTVKGSKRLCAWNLLHFTVRCIIYRLEKKNILFFFLRMFQASFFLHIYILFFFLRMFQAPVSPGLGTRGSCNSANSQHMNTYVLISAYLICLSLLILLTLIGGVLVYTPQPNRARSPDFSDLIQQSPKKKKKKKEVNLLIGCTVNPPHRRPALKILKTTRPQSMWMLATITAFWFFIK